MTTTPRADSSFASESAFSHSEVGLDSAGIAIKFQDIRPWRWPGFPYTGRAVAGCGEEVLAASPQREHAIVAGQHAVCLAGTPDGVRMLFSFGAAVSIPSVPTSRSSPVKLTTLPGGSRLILDPGEKSSVACFQEGVFASAIVPKLGSQRWMAEGCSPNRSQNVGGSSLMLIFWGVDEDCASDIFRDRNLPRSLFIVKDEASERNPCIIVGSTTHGSTSKRPAEFLHINDHPSGIRSAGGPRD